MKKFLYILLSLSIITGLTLLFNVVLELDLENTILFVLICVCILIGIFTNKKPVNTKNTFLNKEEEYTYIKGLI